MASCFCDEPESYDGLFTAEDRAMQEFIAMLPSLDLPPAAPAPPQEEVPAKPKRRAREKKPRTKPKKEEEEVVLASGTVIPSDELLLPLEEDETTVRKNKRKRVPEFDPQSGEWVDVRRFDRMPVTIEEAEEGERASKVPHGAYFVSLAHKRITGIIQLHARWLAKTKNQCSDYADVQRDLMEFFSSVLGQFNQRYAVHTTHPQFESIGKTRKRQQKPSA